ncbi:MAG: ABC transporter ATP-binding protein/permease [Anaerovoracaceae bacterium]
MIAIKNLQKMYGVKTIFSDANWAFPDNGLICILGASGSGKSTLLNILAGFDSNYKGEISVCNTLINQMDSGQLCQYRRDNIGFIFQNYNLLVGYTVMENVLLPCELKGGDNHDNQERAIALLHRLGMSHKVNEKIENLSGGQKQRVAIARALINNPSIILADEPTGALDRKNSAEIMELLKEISKECLVLVITHDKKICAYADGILSISDGKIVGDHVKLQQNSSKKLRENDKSKVSAFYHGLKNFKVHLKKYLAISLAISIGVLAFVMSLSSGNIMEESIVDFQVKNTAFNNGYIKTDNNSDKIVELLRSDQRIENIYRQYIVKNVSLKVGDRVDKMAEKYPMAKAIETMSYGAMPKVGQNEIALSPSLAKKFDKDINKLIGKSLDLGYNGHKYELKISGIFNAGYDDFFVSSDVEKTFYNSTNGESSYSVSYDVKNFADIVSVNAKLKSENIETETAAKEVEALQNTFDKLSKLFLVVSLLVLSVGLFISSILLVKLQNSRYREIGLLSALGFEKKTIRAIIISENFVLSAMAMMFNGVLVGVATLGSIILDFSIIITLPQIIFSMIGTGAVVVAIGVIASYRLIATEPADALRK